MASGIVISRSSVPVVRSRRTVIEVTRNIETSGKNPTSGAPTARTCCGRRRTRTRAASSSGGTTKRSATVRGSWRNWRSTRQRVAYRPRSSAGLSSIRATNASSRSSAPVRGATRPGVPCGAGAVAHEQSRRSDRPPRSRGWRSAASRRPRRAPEHAPQLAPQHRVEPDGRLVEDEQLGLPSSTAASDTRAGSPPESRADELSRTPGSSTVSITARRAPAARRGPREEVEVLPRRQVAVDRRRLRHVADAAAQRRCSRRCAQHDTAPPAIRWTPTTARMSVVLPQPLGPISPVTAPARTVADRSSSALRPPRTTCNRSQRTAGSTDTGAF